MVDEDQSNQEIYQYVQQNYGDHQIAIPRQGWFYRISYGLPFLLIGFISVIALGFAWNWSDRDSDTEELPGDTEDSKRRKINDLVSEEGPLH
jgi:cytochrome c-type biogenesis protein CcmH/NrfF